MQCMNVNMIIHVKMMVFVLLTLEKLFVTARALIIAQQVILKTYLSVEIADQKIKIELRCFGASN